MADDPNVINNETHNLTAEQLTTLERQRKLIEELSKSFRDYNIDIAESINKINDFFSKMKEAEIQSIRTAAQQGNVNDKLNEFKKILESEIDILSRTSGMYKEELNRAIQENIFLELELEKIRKNRQEIDKDLEDRTKKIANETLMLTSKDQNYLNTIEKIIQGKKNLTESDLEEIKNNTKLADNQEKLIEIAKLKVSLSARQSDTDEEEIRRRIEHNRQLQETIPLQLSSIDLQKLQAEHTDKVSDSMDGLVDRLGLTSNKTNIFTSVMMSATKQTNGLGAALVTGLVKDLISPEKALDRFFNFLNKNLIQSSFEFDKNLAAINKSLGGMGKEFEQVAITTAGPFQASAVSGLAQYGVSLEEFGKAYGVLNSKLLGFNQLSEQQRKILASNAAALETLGVSADNYASLASKYMGTLGKSAENANEAINSLARDAIAAGRNVGEYTKEFEQLMPKIIGFGREASQIFKELNAFATMTKGVMSTGDLQGFASQFDNWDSAADSVSKLNAALGGTSVNIADMMRADPSERLMMIKQAFDESGKSFDDMNIGFKRLLAEGFGGDVAKAGAFFKGSLAEANEEMRKMKASEEELEERKKKSVDAQTKLTKAIEGMKIALTPVVSLVSGIADGIISLNENLGGFGGFLTVAIPLGILAVRGMMALFANTVKASFLGIFTEISAGLKTLSAEISAVKTQAANIPPVGGTPAGGAAAGAAGGMSAGFKSLGAIGLVTTLVASAAIAESQASAARKEREETQARERQSSASTTNNNFIGSSNSSVPTLQAGDVTTNKPLYTVNKSTNQLTQIANIDNKDEATKVELATPEERAKQQSLTLAPIQEKIQNMNSSFSAYTDRIVKETNNRSASLAAEHSSVQKSMLERQEKTLSTAISQVSVKTKLEIDKPIVATLRESDAHYIMNKGAQMSLASQNRKEAVLDEVIGV